MDRFSIQKKRRVEEIINRAVQKSHVPGQPSLGTASSPGALVSPGLESNDYANADGDSVRDFMLAVDALGDPLRPLRVEGRRINYYG